MAMPLRIDVKIEMGVGFNLSASNYPLVTHGDALLILSFEEAIS